METNKQDNTVRSTIQSKRKIKWDNSIKKYKNFKYSLKKKL